jgi:hypothetical protein
MKVQHGGCFCRIHDVIWSHEGCGEQWDSGGVADGAEEGDRLLGLHGVFPFARSIGTHPKRLEGALLPSRGIAALPREEVFGKGPGACEGGGVRNPEGTEREF